MTRPRTFLWRLWALVRSRQMDRDIDDEIASHLAEATSEYIEQGLSPEDAHWAALRSFGGVTQTKELHRQVRSFMWLDDLRQDLRHSARTLIKNPVFTLVVILTLALGIGANTTIFTLLDAVIFKPLPVPKPSELVTLYEQGPEGTADVAGGTGQYLRFSHPRFERLEQALGTKGSLAAVTRSSRFAVRLSGDGERHFVLAQLVSGRYFATLGVRAARGRLLTPEDVRLDRVAPVAVISDGFWKRLLGATDTAIGQTVDVNGVSVTVIGIAPPGFAGMWTDAEADLWLPLTLQQALHYQNNSSSYGRVAMESSWLTQDLIAWLNIVGRIAPADRPGVVPPLQAANRQGVTELASLLPDAKNQRSMAAHTLVVAPFSRGFSFLRGRFSDALFALAGMVALVLLITCANIANLLLARAAGHARDVGIRISLGATTGRLIRQSLTESFMLAFLGGAFGLLFGWWASRFLALQVIGTSQQLPVVFTPDERVLAFAVVVSLASAAVFGFGSALRAVGVARPAILGTNQRQAVGHATTTGMRSLVVAQLALSVVLVVAAILLSRTLINFMRIDPGFSKDRLVTASFDPITSGYAADRLPALAGRLVDAARSVPGVASAAVARCGLVAGCSSSSAFRIEAAGEVVIFNENWVTAEYFSTVGIPLIAGRAFDERDTDQGPRVAIVNESIARRYFNGDNPIGRRLGFPRPDTEIVGVARDARTQTVHEPAVPMVYRPLDQKAANAFTPVTNLDVRVVGDPRRAAFAIQEAIRRAEPDLLLGDVGPMSERLSRDLSRERLVAHLASSFAVLAWLLASLGLYGVLSYAVARRTQEIGVRMALGARRTEVMRIVLGQSVRMTIMGIGLGLLGAATGARYLAGMLFGVAPLDPATFVGVSCAFSLVTTLAAYVPARRATRVDPLTALRSE